MSSRPSTAGFFRQSVPAIGLSIEHSTTRVPDDGHFYVVLGEDVKGRFRGKAPALALYRRLIAECGYTPPRAAPERGRNETVERYLDDVEAYWAESHRHIHRGGKGRY